jgi:hypothetical protein
MSTDAAAAIAEQLRGPAAAWRPVLESTLEHALKVVDGFKVPMKDKVGRKARRDRGDAIEEVLEIFDALHEMTVEGRPLPAGHVDELARLAAAVKGLVPGEAGMADLEVRGGPQRQCAASRSV